MKYFEPLKISRGRLITKINPIGSDYIENYKNDSGCFFVASMETLLEMAPVYIMTRELGRSYDQVKSIDVKFRPRDNVVIINEGIFYIPENRAKLIGNDTNEVPKNILLASLPVKSFIEKVDKTVKTNNSYIVVEAVPSLTVSSISLKPSPSL